LGIFAHRDFVWLPRNINYLNVSPFIQTLLGSSVAVISGSSVEWLRSGSRFDGETEIGPTLKHQLPEITATELKQRLDNAGHSNSDVREANEVAVARATDSYSTGPGFEPMSEIDPAPRPWCNCKMGGRSARAIEALKRSVYRQPAESHWWHYGLVE